MVPLQVDDQTQPQRRWLEDNVSDLLVEMEKVVRGFYRDYTSVTILGQKPPSNYKYTVLPGAADVFTHVLDITPATYRGRKYWYATLGKNAYLWGPFGGITHV